MYRPGSLCSILRGGTHFGTPFAEEQTVSVAGLEAEATDAAAYFFGSMSISSRSDRQYSESACGRLVAGTASTGSLIALVVQKLPATTGASSERHEG